MTATFDGAGFAPRQSRGDSNRNALGLGPVQRRRGAVSWQIGCALVSCLFHTAVAVAVAVAAFAVAVAPVRFDDLQGLRVAELAVELNDASDVWIGIIPAAVSGGRGRDLHKAIEPTTVPDAWYAVLLALEDQHLDWRTIVGQDLSRQAYLAGQALWDIASAGIGRSRGGRVGKGGGSGLASQLARGLRELPATGELDVERKLVELFDGWTLYAMLGGRNGDLFQRWVATHSTLITGISGSGLGGEIRGIALAARVLWNKPVTRLSLAEQAVLAAAVRWTVWIGPGVPNAAQMARWNKTKDRAAFGLRLAFGETEEVATAVTEITGMPFPRPQLSAELTALIPASVAFRTAANPAARAANLAPGIVSEVHRELVARYGAYYAETVAAVALAIDSADNLAFARRIDAELTRVDTALGPKLSLAVTPNDPRPPADIVVALVDDAGAVRRFFSRGPSAYWTSAADGTGTRQIGSLGKIIAAIALGEAGDTGDRLYCNRNLPDHSVRNAGGHLGFDDCATRGAAVTARDAFGRSINLPVIDALSRVPEGRLGEIAAALGFKLDAQAPVRVGIPLGLISAAPADVATLMLTAAQIALRISSPTPVPTFMTDVTLRSSHAPPPTTANRARLASIPSRAAFVSDVLSAPLAAGGTLARLGDWLRSQRISTAFAKSGTADGEQGLVEQKWIAATAKGGGRLWTVVVMVGSPDPGMPLGTEIGDSLTNLAIEAFRGVIGK